MLAIASADFFQGRGFPAALPTPHPRARLQARNAARRTDEASGPNLDLRLAISLPYHGSFVISLVRAAAFTE
jgi:hypothetical protein